MNACKEDSCYVSLDYDNDMKQSQIEASVNSRKNPHFQFNISRDYVLPDFTTIRRGFLKPADQTGKTDQADTDQQQLIRLNNERFSVPELLFSPSDVGIQQCGIPATIVESILQCDPDAHPWLFRNIVLTGGSACLPNIRSRIEREVRALAPDVYDVRFKLVNVVKLLLLFFSMWLYDFLKIQSVMHGQVEQPWPMTQYCPAYQ